MNLIEVLNLVTPDVARSLAGFAPEILIVVTIVLLLVWRLFQRAAGSNMSGLALVGALLALVASLLQLCNFVGRAALAEGGPTGKAAASLAGWISTAPAKASDEPIDLFTGAVKPIKTNPTNPDPTPKGMLRFDGFTVFFRMFLFAFAAFVIWLTKLTGIPDSEDSPDFYTLLLGATLGMSLMASANHLLMIYIAVEMASLPSYAMAGFLKGRRDASEASLKYVVYGAGASGVMLYGISLLIGRFGTAHLPSLAVAMAQPVGGPLEGIVILGLLLLLVGVAFKIAAVPFHFWCPDVFEGAAAEVAGFLSVASKAAALALLARITVSLTINEAISTVRGHPPVDMYLGAAIAFLAAVTATYGNLAAYAQTNLKRLLAFSTIAHAGYMMMPLAAAITLSREQTSAARPALEALVFYLVIYLFMNLGAFAVVALIRNQIRSEDLKDYSGLIRRNPLLTVAMAVFLLSLTGIPPLAGFAAKWSIIYVLFEAELYWLLAVILANTVFSAFYYVKVLRVMILDEPPESAPSWTVLRPAAVFCSVLVAANFVVMMIPKAWDGMTAFTNMAVPDLLEAFRF
jgi:NADH-quinone oxidoreductase subunit N